MFEEKSPTGISQAEVERLNEEQRKVNEIPFKSQDSFLDFELSVIFAPAENNNAFSNVHNDYRQHTGEPFEPTQNPFPLDVFPAKVQQIINETNKCLNFPIDYMGASILYAVSVAIGNTHDVEVQRGWQERAVLYIVLVGKKGAMKTHPIKWALKPIQERDKEKFNTYKEQLKEYKTALARSKSEGTDPPEKPVPLQMLLGDATLESVQSVHDANKRGIGIDVDEFRSWYKNFNRYNSGNDESFWLSNWSLQPLRVNRKTSDPIFIELPFISVIGTIQPALLNDLAENRTEDGFLDRLLFVTTENQNMPYWSNKEVNQDRLTDWKTIISNLLQLELTPDGDYSIRPKTLKFNPEAKEILRKWQRSNADEGNNSINDDIRGILTKMQQYAIRLALCLEMLRYACIENEAKEISPDSVRGALKLVEYFKNSARRVLTTISNDSPLERLPANKQRLYELLPETFKKGTGVAIADSLGVKDRMFGYFLNDKNLFKRVKQGEYEKLL